LLVDTHTWARIDPRLVQSFRGFTYHVRDWKNSLTFGYALAFFTGVGLLRVIRPSEDKGSDDR
jgi:hypothetical protein